MIETDDEKIVTGYDPELVRRLVAFARPFLGYLAAAIVCLVIATTGEMMVPVMIQRTVDRQVLDFWIELEVGSADFIAEGAERYQLGERLFVREEALDQISRPEREELQRSGTLDPTRLAIVPMTDYQPVAQEHPELSESIVAEGSDWVALTAQSFETLPAQARLTLRAQNIAGLQRNAIIFLLILAGVLVATFGQVYLTAYTGQLVMKSLRLKLFGHVMHQHLGFLGTQPVGRLVTRVTNDVETINELFTSVLAQLARNLALMLAVIITMFSLNARLAAAVLASMVPVLLLTELFRRRARNAYRNARRAVSRVNAYLAEYVSGMPIVQAFVQQARSRSEFGERNDSLLKASLAEMYVFAVFRPLIDLLATISTAVVIYMGARLLSIEMVSLGVLIAFTNLIRRFYMPVMNLSDQFTILQSALAGSERIFDTLDDVQRIPDEGRKSPAEGEGTEGRIQFENVSFGYKDDDPVIHDLSVEIEPGALAAVVGHTGSGKTTLINLLTRLWDVNSGRILLDGRDIREYSLASLRRTVQQIQQDVFLFSDTIRANITLGAEVSEEKIWEACEAVQVAQTIRALPDGLDTVLHERGSNLSAGQRQLISFARVLVHDPPVLVLDEATASIDSETERLLQAAVATVTAGRTSLVIAHRLSTIRHADVIFTLTHGEVAEQGRHDELLEQDGLYARLYRLQFAASDTARG